MTNGNIHLNVFMFIITSFYDSFNCKLSDQLILNTITNAKYAYIQEPSTNIVGIKMPSSLTKPGVAVHHRSAQQNINCLQAAVHCTKYTMSEFGQYQPFHGC